MPKLTVRFNDNEVIEGEATDLSLDSPDFHLQVSGHASNNHGAWIPLPAVKRLSLASGPADAHAEEADKMVAVRFTDGEVIRGYLNGSLQHHRYGMTMTLYSQDKRSMDVVGIPYTSLKALWYLKSWDGRPPGFQAQGAATPPLLQLLGDVREVTRLYQAGHITREEFISRRRSLIDRF
ncbi:MAG TPA: hypothetical protein VG245_06950 [Candidatus Dormibacteraeota bacterium]|nr:hypothetical protein [Candidatus Dormibacteraeota bacterium]